MKNTHLKIKQNRCLDAILDLAQTQFGFSVHSLAGTCRYQMTYVGNSNTLVTITETILHEICHVIAEDNRLEGTQSNQRPFKGHLNELKTLALQGVTLQEIQIPKWSIKTRVSASMDIYDAATIVPQMMRDPELQKSARQLASMIKERALSTSGNDYLSFLKYVLRK